MVPGGMQFGVLDGRVPGGHAVLVNVVCCLIEVLVMVHAHVLMQVLFGGTVWGAVCGSGDVVGAVVRDCRRVLGGMQFGVVLLTNFPDN